MPHNMYIYNYIQYNMYILEVAELKRTITRRLEPSSNLPTGVLPGIGTALGFHGI